MECQEFRKSIPEFASMSLKYDQMARCLEHVEGCASCRDELEIYFIVERGIKDNEAFDQCNFHNRRPDLSGDGDV